MLKELIDKLLEVGKERAGFQEIDKNDTEVIIFTPGGELLHVDKDHRRDHTVHDLASMQSAIARWVSGGTVWHCETGIIALTDDDPRIDRIRLDLTPSRQFNAIDELPSAGISQRDLIKLLRNDLHGTGGAESLLPIVRRVKFTTSRESNQQRDSMGQSVDAAVNAADDLPDSVEFLIPVFDQPDIIDPQPVRCSFDVNFEIGTFLMLPYPGQLRKATDATQNWISGELSACGDDITVLYGTP